MITKREKRKNTSQFFPRSWNQCQPSFANCRPGVILNIYERGEDSAGYLRLPQPPLNWHCNPPQGNWLWDHCRHCRTHWWIWNFVSCLMTSLQSKKYLVLNYWILLLKKGPFLWWPLRNRACWQLPSCGWLKSVISRWPAPRSSLTQYCGAGPHGAGWIGFSFCVGWHQEAP